MESVMVANCQHSASNDCPICDGTRIGDWIQTYPTCTAFWPIDPRPEEVHIEDIAHHLGNICRYTGGTSRFYSVAEHSVYVSQAVPPEHALWGLLHDASEAYLTDIARPVKKYLTDYAPIEHRIMEVIAKKFDLPWPEPPEVKEIDNRILMDEKAALKPGHPPRPWDNIKGGALGIAIQGVEPWYATMMFKKRFTELTGYAFKEVV